MIHHEPEREGCEEKEPEDMIETIVKRFLKEQTSIKDNTLEIAIVENPQSTQDEDEKISRYMMLARLEVGRSSMKNEPEVTLKAMRATRDYKQAEGKTPSWKRDKETSQSASSSTGTKETEKAEERLQTLKKTLTSRITKPESPESSDSDGHAYEDESESEGEFLPAKEGTKIANTTPKQQEKKRIQVYQDLKREPTLKKKGTSQSYER
jgi:hypothetical protein